MGAVALSRGKIEQISGNCVMPADDILFDSFRRPRASHPGGETHHPVRPVGKPPVGEAVVQEVPFSF
jgi:hypothetical protein